MEGIATAPRALTEEAAWPRGLTMGVAERRALVVLGDVLLLNLGLFVTAAVVPKPGWLRTLFPGPALLNEWFVVLTGLWLLGALLTDCYSFSVAGSRYSGPVRTAAVGLLVLVAYSLVPVVTPPFLKSRLMWGVLTLATVIPLMLWRFVYAALLGHPLLTRRVLIIGTARSARLLAEAVIENPAHGYRPIGVVTVDDQAPGPLEAGSASVPRVSGVPVLGSAADLPHLLFETEADELVVAASGALGDDAFRAITSAYESGIRVTPLSRVYEALTGRIPVEHVGHNWVTVLPQENAASISFAVIKRTLDVAGGALGLVALGLLVVPIAIAIRLDSPGPILFSQERIGQRGRRFRIYKLRTLPIGGSEPADSSIWVRKTTRPTRVGRFLRRSRLDELPQFWNVLRGDMSLVGPRPFVPADVEELQRQIPFFRSRLLVRPGLTGWAQVRGGYGITLADELTKLQYDLYYVRHQSPVLDLFILLKTIAVVLRLAGR